MAGASTGHAIRPSGPLETGSTAFGNPVLPDHSPETVPPALSLSRTEGLPFPAPLKSSGGKSFGSSSFKSIRSFDSGTKPAASSSLPAPSTGSSVTVYHSYSPPVVFFWMPGVSHTPFSGEAALGWLIVVVVLGVLIVMIVVLATRRRGPSKEEQEEIHLFLDRCEKNLNHLADRYVEAGTWLESLKAALPGAEWRELNDTYTEIRIEDFTRQLDEIKKHIADGELATARTLLFSFDDDAVDVFEFLEGLEKRWRDLKNARD